MLRLTQRLLSNQQFAKGFHTSAQCTAITRFNLPAMSPTMTEGTIHQWKFKEGESFSAGDVLLELETDKAQIDVEAADDGVLAKIVLPDGGKAAVNSLIALIAEEGDDISNVQVPEEETTSAAVTEKTEEKVEEPEKKKAAPSVSPISHHDVDTSKLKKPLSPAVLSLVLKYGIKDVGSIEPSGYGGRLLKGDVLAHLGLIQSKPAPKPTLSIAPPRDQIVFAKTEQQQQQKETVQKKEAPPTFISKQLTLNNIFDLHESLKDQKKVKGTTVNDVIAKAAERALQDIKPSAKGGDRFKQPIVYRESSSVTSAKKYKGGEFKVFNLAEPTYDFITDSYENSKPYVLHVEPVLQGSNAKQNSRKENDDMVDFIDYLGAGSSSARRPQTTSAQTKAEIFDIKLDGKVPGKILNDGKAKVFLDRVEYYVQNPNELY